MPEPEVSLNFLRLGPTQNPEAKSGTTQPWIGVPSTAYGDPIARVPEAYLPRVVAGFALTLSEGSLSGGWPIVEAEGAREHPMAGH